MYHKNGVLELAFLGKVFRNEKLVISKIMLFLVLLQTMCQGLAYKNFNLSFWVMILWQLILYASPMFIFVVIYIVSISPH